MESSTYTFHIMWLWPINQFKVLPGKKFTANKTSWDKVIYLYLGNESLFTQENVSITNLWLSDVKSMFNIMLLNSEDHVNFIWQLQKSRSIYSALYNDCSADLAQSQAKLGSKWHWSSCFNLSFTPQAWNVSNLTGPLLMGTFLRLT